MHELWMVMKLLFSVVVPGSCFIKFCDTSRGLKTKLLTPVMLLKRASLIAALAATAVAANGSSILSLVNPLIGTTNVRGIAST